MTMTLDEMVAELKSGGEDNLLSVLLYGSAAAGDHAGKKSDYNLLVVAKTLEVPYLRKISKASVRWVKQGNPPPLLFTKERLQSSSDVFPIEFSDIKENHKVLFGEDPFTGFSVSSANLRLELEHELKGKLIQLRERFLLTEGKTGEVRELMVRTLSTFLVLFKNALRLYDETPPAKKLEALARLNTHIPCDVEVFKIVERMKEGEKIKGVEMVDLFARYLKTVENIVDGIDKFMRKG